MIRAVMEPGALVFEVSGHAGYAEHGQDIVCAAASMLAFTLAKRMKEMDDQGLLSALDIRQGTEGYLRLYAKPQHPIAEGMARAAFDTIRAGYRLLVEKYPENIRLE